MEWFHITQRPNDWILSDLDHGQGQ